MAQKDRKVHKMRGSRNCGFGNTKKHRGSGSRGGRGNAGGCNHHWSYVSKFDPLHYGRRGFKRPVCMLKTDVTINVGQLDSSLERFISEGKATQDGNSYVIDLTGIGFDKLLGSGRVNHAIQVKVERSTKSAIEKIEAAGGKVEVVEGGGEFFEVAEAAGENAGSGDDAE